MNTYVVVALVAALGGTHYWAFRRGVEHEEAAHLRAEAASRENQDKVTEAISVGLSKIEVKHVTIRQQADTVIREVPVYRECRHDARVLRDINEARGAAGDGELPVAASGPAR